MARTHLILANHPAVHANRPLRGLGVTRYGLKQVLERNPNKKFHVILEDIFTDRRYMTPQISNDERLQENLREETAKHRRHLAKIKARIDKGEEKSDDYPVWADVAKANKEMPGRLTLHFSDFDETSQVKTLLGQYWREQGYHLAYRSDEEIDSAIGMLLDGMKLMAEVVAHRDKMVVEQREALGGDAIISYGFNHQNLCLLQWGETELKIYNQAQNGLSYWDELLIRITTGQEPEEKRKKEYMYAEIVYNGVFLQAMRSFPMAMPIEDLKQAIRETTAQQMGF